MALPQQVSEFGPGRFQGDRLGVFARRRPLPLADEWVKFHGPHMRTTGIAADAGPIPTVRLDLP